MILKDHIILATYIDGTTQVLGEGFYDYQLARFSARCLWENTFNRGFSEHTPNMHHSSGILRLEVVRRNFCPDCDGTGIGLTTRSGEQCDRCGGDGHVVNHKEMK